MNYSSEYKRIAFTIKQNYISKANNSLTNSLNINTICLKQRIDSQAFFVDALSSKMQTAGITGVKGGRASKAMTTLRILTTIRTVQDA